MINVIWIQNCSQNAYLINEILIILLSFLIKIALNASFLQIFKKNNHMEEHTGEIIKGRYRVLYSTFLSNG